MQPTVNNSDSSPSFTSTPRLTQPGPQGDHFSRFVLEHIRVYLQLYLTKGKCAHSALFTVTESYV